MHSPKRAFGNDGALRPAEVAAKCGALGSRRDAEEPRGETPIPHGGWKEIDDDFALYFDDRVTPADAAWLSQLRAYERMRVVEVVCFAKHAAAARRLRVWDLHAGRLTEREVHGGRTLSRVLGVYWTTGNGDAQVTEERCLRLEDVRGRVVVDGVALRRLWCVALEVSSHAEARAPESRRS